MESNSVNPIQNYLCKFSSCSKIYFLCILKKMCTYRCCMCIYMQTNLNASEGCKRLLARSQGDDVSFYQQTDRQVNQLGVAVGPVKGP